MKPVRHTDTLVHCDGVQVFEGRDPAGGRYVGVMVDGGDGSDRYLVTGVASERLRRFRSGALDLRSVLLEAGRDEWYFADVSDDFQAPLRLMPQDGSLEGRDFLPDEGFVLHDGPVGGSTAGEARPSRGRHWPARRTVEPSPDAPGQGTSGPPG